MATLETVRAEAGVLCDTAEESAESLVSSSPQAVFKLIAMVQKLADSLTVCQAYYRFSEKISGSFIFAAFAKDSQSVSDGSSFPARILQIVTW